MCHLFFYPISITRSHCHRREHRGHSHCPCNSRPTSRGYKPQTRRMQSSISQGKRPLYAFRSASACSSRVGGHAMLDSQRGLVLCGEGKREDGLSVPWCTWLLWDQATGSLEGVDGYFGLGVRRCMGSGWGFLARVFGLLLWTLVDALYCW